MFLTGDYLKTSFQLACAEGANEAGRIAANAILKATDYQGDMVPIWKIDMPSWLVNIQAKDQAAWDHDHQSIPPSWPKNICPRQGIW
jgi:hypothetical protein